MNVRDVFSDLKPGTKDLHFMHLPFRNLKF